MKKCVVLMLSALLLAVSLTALAEPDVVIIGAGGAGLSAALEAVAQGAEDVVILEMTGKTGGSLNYTSGSMSAANTIIQQEDGIEDTVESYVQDILKNGSTFGGTPNEELIREFCEEDTEVFNWLYENGLKDCTFSTDSQGRRAVFAPEHALYSIQRTYKARAKDTTTYKSAAHEVLDTLLTAEERITVVYNTKATGLVANEKGQVLTVVAEGPDGEVRYTATKGIIVCTGGYSANGKLMAEYVENGDKYLAGGPSSADGNGLLLMQQVGAGLTSMDAIPTFPMGLVSRDNPTTGQIASTYTWKTGGIVVNQEGNRFVNETESDPAIREVALEQQTNAVQYDIFTDKIVEDLRAAGGSYFYDAYFANDTLPGAHVRYEADSLEELAELIGVPAENLIATVEAYNAAVDGGASDEFGRLYDGTTDSYNLAVNKLEGEKYYAIRLQALCVMTLGGVTANKNMQVLDEAGNVIPGLYAAGEVVGGIWGKFVSGGTGVMGPIVFGKIAARNVMTSELEEGYEVKPASAMLDESLFAKETSSESLFDMARALNDGEYTATVDGQEGPMTVKTVIEAGKIASVEVVENAETQSVAGNALATIPQRIVDANSADVDAVTGATLTSGRIMKAVAQCLEDAAQ